MDNKKNFFKEFVAVGGFLKNVAGIVFFRKKKRKIFYGLLALGAVLFFVGIIRQATPPIAVLFKSVQKHSRQLWKEMVCDSALESELCRKKCAEKDPASVWCDDSRYNLHVPVDGMITYVAEGGCAISAASCSLEEECPALTCMAECPSDPRRVITKRGCECEGNWSPYGDECVCAEPFVMINGECIDLPQRECDNDVQESGSVFECGAPLSQVGIYWRGKHLYACEGSCYSLLCVSNDSISIDGYRYFRGKFYDVISAERGSLRSYAPAMGGYYGVCRAPL